MHAARPQLTGRGRSGRWLGRLRLAERRADLALPL
jgi:hypothetical protein